MLGKNGEFHNRSYLVIPLGVEYIPDFRDIHWSVSYFGELKNLTIF